MKKRYIVIIISFIATGLFFACKGTSNDKIEETSTTGTLTLYVDNTVQPITEDVVAVFESVYDRATITQVNKAENEIVNALLSDTAKVAIMTRQLTPQEENHFKQKNVVPKVTEFAVDAIALIVNERTTDSIIDIEEVLKVLKGEPSEKINKLVFDNQNSSTVQFLLKRAGVTTVPAKNVYSLKTNEEVIKYINNNAGAVGIVGVNWLVQPPLQLKEYVQNIKVLAVSNIDVNTGEKKYYKPSQSDIATGLYPLTRKVYVLNYQGKDGLGTGFAIYIRAHEGQRIILKSGLLPVEIPTRDIEVRKEL
ncbi:phosphate ABC transporter substrate-binding protein [Flavobacterium arcticum]|uniref:Phosphate ABC transporter substrate-binding protein n=1 Tax=Flavobacterium arcticum TaxID=1784713 RepID=A0A345HCG2_9FLAO|nr:substrate-binding domain-containing protein [Flavobacterium arcticum]AXG74272.1 phosphate ABC transporter substrate-binding protein [Flavobacterium arcticum]KAF2508138.1 phosphate ABC transporter substrate-binding protein [Flavobacterium arcticum]